MCKHVAATLYGIGARLDQRPELLFLLRHVDGSDLITQASSGTARAGESPSRTRLLDEAGLGDVFGIEMAQTATAGTVSRPAAGRARQPGTAARTRALARKKPTQKRKPRT